MISCSHSFLLITAQHPRRIIIIILSDFIVMVRTDLDVEANHDFNRLFLLLLLLLLELGLLMTPTMITQWIGLLLPAKGYVYQHCNNCDTSLHILHSALYCMNKYCSKVPIIIVILISSCNNHDKPNFECFLSPLLRFAILKSLRVVD